MNQQPKPTHEIRLGSVKAAIWANMTDFGPMYSVTVTRLYKQGEEWKTSESFHRDDLPLVMKVADMAHTWIFQNGKRN